MAPDDRLSLIHFLQSVHPLPDAAAKNIAKQFAPIEIKKGEFFLEEGKRSNEYLFLQGGILRSYLFDTDGAEVTTNFYSAGNVVFEAASFFQRIPAQENIQAMSDCEGWRLSYDELNNLFHSLPAFREIGRAVLVRTLVALKMRMLSMINKTAEQRYAALLTSHPEIFQHVPLKYIASYLGITDTSLSRIRREFVHK